MRTGEMAALVGVTPRAVRHYHHVGVLPEPERDPNGYRRYTLRHAVLLARIRRLTELGLGLDEVRDVLADDAGRELAEVLEELDDDLARQERLIRERRERLSPVLEDARAGRLTSDGPLSPQLAGLLASLGGTAGSPMAELDREVLTLLDAVMPPEERERLMGTIGAMAARPDTVERAHGLYRLLDELADAPSDDPRVARAGELMAELIPAEMLAGWDDSGPDAAAAEVFFSG
ncbi:MerR family transcriptional regulator, partial [Streptomyces sp. UH6]|uniref:MerR family transcriptional regulator n=1 Tax=Streptomyces sp. UH6 TaxID=2748379 RepID=UPI0015D4F1D9